jgi:hypothetical protein
VPSLTAAWPRRLRRAHSRRLARQYAFYNGPAPRYEAARNDTCEQHHRKLPCKRCAGDTR